MTNRQALIQSLRIPTAKDPLRVLSSACLLGIQCGYDGSSYGQHPKVYDLQSCDRIQLIKFCPEEFSFGTPRALCDIHGGDGFDVLDGKAKVLTEAGEDWTSGMLAGAEQMLKVAQRSKAELCILMDISAACGSQVIYNGNRNAEGVGYQKGTGVCAALLMRHGFPVIAQRDYASLELLYAKLFPGYEKDPIAVDHNETDWYQKYFH